MHPKARLVAALERTPDACDPKSVGSQRYAAVEPDAASEATDAASEATVIPIPR